MDTKEERIIKYNLAPKQCLCCNTVIVYEKRINTFCNFTCAATYNNTKYPKRTKDRVKGDCLICNKKVKFYHSKFCSNECKVENIRRIETKKFDSGEMLSVEAAKKQLLKHKEYKCEVCKRSEWNSKRLVLEIDHINGDRRNNSLNNLRLLCPNCHSQTDTFRGKNVKKHMPV